MQDQPNPTADAGDAEVESRPLLLTPREWRTLLERRSFLERDDSRFQAPRRFCGRPVRIVPDESFR